MKKAVTKKHGTVLMRFDRAHLAIALAVARRDAADEDEPLPEPTDGLALAPEVAPAARAIRRTWSADERVRRALWAYSTPFDWRQGV